MADISMRYMTVTLSRLEDGINLSCWMTTTEFWMSEQQQFPHQYTYMGDTCTWIIHSNEELTFKACQLVCEEADGICKRQQQINDNRKIANR